MGYGINEAMGEINDKIMENISHFKAVAPYADDDGACQSIISALEGLKYKVEAVWGKLEKSGALDEKG